MRDVILTGFMGTGKTTVAGVLADRFGLELLDLDAEIERRSGRSVPRIIAESGEAAFRSLERDVLRGLGESGGRVVATGGGSLLEPESRALLSRDSLVICLTCREEELLRRLGDGEGRPLLGGRGPEGIIDLLEQRQPVYRSFPHRIDTTDLSPEDVADRIAVDANLSCTTFPMGNGHTTLLFGRALAADLGRLLGERSASGAALFVTDRKIISLNSVGVAIASTASRDGMRAHTVRLPPGEEAKTLETVREVYEACLELGMDRSSTVVGIGGGAVCDVAGFAAATYMRGVRLVLVPTTLLAMVDAAMGGKTGVDLGGVKNLVGAFHPAEMVVLDPDMLRTLPESALADGLAEIVKIAVMFSSRILARIDRLREASDILRQTPIIRQAAELKARVASSDTYERGERALLNFGHTVGHALEAASGYGLSHGHAVAVGMVAETWLAERKGWCEAGLTNVVAQMLTRFGLPTAVLSVHLESAFDVMRHDKKREGGTIRFAIPVALGRGTLVDVADVEARAALARALGVAQ